MFGLFSSAPALSVDEVREGLKNDTLVLVDVREVGEVAMSGKAKGAIHVPLVNLQMKADPRSPECLSVFKDGKPVVTYCASGARSQNAVQMLKNMGHSDVKNLGGLRDWAAGGGEISRG